jgi:hypothetical protein
MDIQQTAPLPQQTPPPVQTQLSDEEQRTQHINTVVQTSSSVAKTILSGLSRIGREIAMMILKR